jgi:hypothetical protein
LRAAYELTSRMNAALFISMPLTQSTLPGIVKLLPWAMEIASSSICIDAAMTSVYGRKSVGSICSRSVSSSMISAWS